VRSTTHRRGSTRNVRGPLVEPVPPELARGVPHDLHAPPARLAQPVRQRARVPLVGPHEAEAWQGVRGDAPDEVPRPLAVLHVGGVHAYGEHEAERVDEDVPLAPVQSLRAVVAPRRAADAGGLRARAVDDRRTRLGLASRLAARQHAEHVVRAPEGAVEPPARKRENTVGQRGGAAAGNSRGSMRQAQPERST
jgi:hypothetical protein